jgi:hypothetical protein
MKTIESLLVCISVLCFFVSEAKAQAQYAEYGTRAGFNAINTSGSYNSNEDDTWNSCTKLALSTNDIPKAPRGLSGLPFGFKGLDPSELNEGAVGYLEHLQRTTVVNILSESEMVITFGSTESVSPTYVCLTNYPTKGRVDDESIRLIGPIIASGTRQYKNRFGKTITRRVIRFMTADEIKAYTKSLKLPKLPKWD